MVGLFCIWLAKVKIQLTMKRTRIALKWIDKNIIDKWIIGVTTHLKIDI